MKLKVWLVVISLLLCLPLFAQNYTGSIQGSVTDQTGAVVSGAQVTITNTATAETHSATTSSEGTYNFPTVAAGVYELRVKAGSFKESVTKNVEVHVSTITTVNAGLQVGSAGDQVTVEANAIQVETATGAVGNVVEGREVRELPLNGRSFVQLTQLMPGVSPATNFDSKNKGLMSGVDFSVNGNYTTGNLYLVDGVNNNDIGSNRTILIYPSIDAIQEFKILRNSYPPEYGQAMGAIVSIITRGGTNQFHGSAFYEGRNAALNATDYFNTLNGVGKDALVRNDYGYTIGGPIIKDKLFFFWEQEWNHEQRGKVRAAQVPGLAERTGDFSTLQTASDGSACEPAPVDRTNSNAVFTDVSQASARAGFADSFSPVGLLYVQLYPTPNIPASQVNPGTCNNWGESPTSPIRWRQENIRGDYKITPTLSMMGRYTQDHWAQPFPSTLGMWGDDIFPVVESSWAQPGKQATIKLTKQLGSTAVNDFQLSYAGNRINVTRAGTDPGLNDQINAIFETGFPYADKSRGRNIGHPLFWGSIGNGTEPGTNLWTQGPWRNNEQLLIVKDDLSKVVGTHTFKVGFLGTSNQKNEEINNSSGENTAFWGPAGWLMPGGNDTGNGIFNLLWNQTYYGGGETQGNPFSQGRWHDFEFYFGDSWKVRRNLTVEYGFRWSLLRRVYLGNDLAGNFDATTYDPALGGDPCNGIVVPKSQASACSDLGFAGGSVGVNRSLQPQNNHTIAPRVGIAWDPKGDGKMAIRAGGGQFFQRDRVSIWTGMANNNPFGLNIINENRPLDSAPCLSAAFNVASNPACDPAVNTVGGTPSFNAPNTSLEQTSALPNTWQWNLTIEREIVQNTKIELGYVGNKAIHAQRWTDLNTVPLADRLEFATNNSNPSSGTANNSLRPFGAGNWGILHQAQFDGSANYHSLQALFRTRMKSVDAQFAYTWSHSLADTDFTSSGGANAENTLADPANPRLNYGNTYINRPNTLVGNIVYTLPTLAGHSAPMRYAVGGWELSSIIDYASGSSLTVFANGGAGGAPGYFTGSGVDNGTFRPERVSGQPCRSNSSNPIQWLNPNGWTLQGFQVGSSNGMSAFGECAGPGIANTDFSIHKNFKATERLNVQFRMDFFNLFNKTQFKAASNGNEQIQTNFLSSSFACTANLGATNASAFNDPRICNGVVNNQVQFFPNGLVDDDGAGPDTSQAPGRQNNFGQVQSDRGPREIQYQIKFEF